MNLAARIALTLGVIWPVSFGLVYAQAPQGQQPGTPPAAQPQPKPPEYPPYAEVIKEHEKVVSTMEGKPSMYTLWVRKKDNQVLAELPPDYVMKKYFIALTIAGGEQYAGLQAGDMYVYWKPYDKRLALIEPNIGTRS